MYPLGPCLGHHLKYNTLVPAATHLTMVIFCKQEFVKGLKLRHGSAVIPIGQLSVGLPRHRSLLFKALADACELPCRLLRGRFYTGGSEEKAVVMVRSLDQEVRSFRKSYMK